MRDELIRALSGAIPNVLATALVDEFIVIRRDVAQGLLGRSAPGKFVEVFAQILQYLTVGTYDVAPAVSRVLQQVEGDTRLEEGLRLCAARAAATMYTLRNKRSIAHKNGVDPNPQDLQFLCCSAQWIMGELVRVVSGCTVEEAHALVEKVRAPVTAIVEDFGSRKLVLPDLPVREEILVFLHSEYPRRARQRDLLNSLNRASARSILTGLRALWKQKLVDGTPESGYVLTQVGLHEAGVVLLGIAF